MPDECCSRDSGDNFDTCYHTITQVSYTCLMSAVHVIARVFLALSTHDRTCSGKFHLSDNYCSRVSWNNFQLTLVIT